MKCCDIKARRFGGQSSGRPLFPADLGLRHSAAPRIVEGCCAGTNAAFIGIIAASHLHGRWPRLLVVSPRGEKMRSSDHSWRTCQYKKRCAHSASYTMQLDLYVLQTSTGSPMAAKDVKALSIYVLVGFITYAPCCRRRYMTLLDNNPFCDIATLIEAA